MSPPDAVEHTHIHAIDLAVSNKTELTIAVRTLEQHAAGRFAVVKEDFHHIAVEEDCRYRNQRCPRLFPS